MREASQRGDAGGGEPGMKLVFFGLTITSSWGNGHATTYRSLLRALAARGHRVHFVEKDVEWYRCNRDLPAPDYCSVGLYGEWEGSCGRLIELSRDADAVVIGSYFPDASAAMRALLESGQQVVLFYDIDTPVTVSQLRAEGSASYLDADLIPHYSAYLSFSGGPILHEIETCFGSRWAVPFYCSVDPEIYKQSAVQEPFRCDLSYLGTYAADRQSKLMELLNHSAQLAPERRFIVAGPQYPAESTWAPNVDRIAHLAPPEHPPFYSSSRFTLNLTRADMAAAGYSPSVRLFEASACAATIVSDAWPGLEEFLKPGEEILLPRNAMEVTQILNEMGEADRIRMGRRAQARILDQHTSRHRAIEFEQIVEQCARVQLHAGISSASD